MRPTLLLPRCSFQPIERGPSFCGESRPWTCGFPPVRMKPIHSLSSATESASRSCVWSRARVSFTAPYALPDHPSRPSPRAPASPRTTSDPRPTGALFSACCRSNSISFPAAASMPRLSCSMEVRTSAKPSNLPKLAMKNFPRMNTLINLSFCKYLENQDDARVVAMCRANEKVCLEGTH
jgi:hypothetical protein